MNTSKTALVAAAAVLLAVSTKAPAADIAAYKAPIQSVAPFSWTGLYVGLDVGGEFSARPINGNVTGNNVFLNGLGNPGILGAGATGWAGGGHVGFNYQVSPVWVLGIETGIKATGLNNSASVSSMLTTFSYAVPWEWSVVGRVGLLVEPRLMLYGLGGVEFAEIQESASAPLFGFTSASFNNVHTGWTAGAGLEYYLTNNLSAGLEYRYWNVGTHGLTIQNPNVAVAFNPSTTAAANAAFLRMNVKF